MKNNISSSDHVRGAWQFNDQSEEHIVLYIDAYFTHTTYNKASKKFMGTRGGNYIMDNGKLSVTYEFDTRDNEQVGKSISYKASQQKSNLITNVTGVENTWTRVDNGAGNLSGLWQITQRKQDGNLVSIHQTGTRKTIKILSATRFQWAAIDPGTKSFSGTGGGTYTFDNGKYTEHIEFFSRDSTRVGSVLTFDGKLESGDWHHSGLSSRGEPIYEVWSRKK